MDFKLDTNNRKDRELDKETPCQVPDPSCCWGLHPNLICKPFIIDLPLCRVLLEDNLHYPWLFLVPRKPHVSRLIDLSPEEQVALMHELALAQQILWDLFSPTQLNVAALGNKTPQLHIHVIARKETDPAWPAAVWDHPANAPYADDERAALIARLRSAFDGAMVGEEGGFRA